jgi:hypothetical protein
MSPEAVEAWGEVIAYAEKWVGGPRWVGGEVQYPPALRPELVDALAAVGGLRRVAYRTIHEEHAMRAHFARVDDLRVPGGVA